MSRFTPCSTRYSAVRSPVSPAPINMAVCCRRSVKIFRASSTATELTETEPAPISVRSRTSLPTASAFSNSRLRTSPVVFEFSDCM